MKGKLIKDDFHRHVEQLLHEVERCVASFSRSSSWRIMWEDGAIIIDMCYFQLRMNSFVGNFD